MVQNLGFGSIDLVSRVQGLYGTLLGFIGYSYFR